MKVSIRKIWSYSMRVAMQEMEQNCITAHQRPILGATVPHQKNPQQYESLQKALHIFSGVNCPRGHSFHRPAVGLPAICSLHCCKPPDARSAVFWRDPRKPCWHSLPLQLGLGHSRGLGQQAFCLLSTSSPTHPAHLPHLVFRHICTRLGKMSPDTEVKRNLKL